MIWIVTMWRREDNETRIDCLKATYEKARAHIDIKNRGQDEWFYQIYEKEIE